MSIFRSILRLGTITGVVTAAAVGGTALLAGPQRTSALFDKAKESVIERIDTAIDDPAALRAQLHELQSRYPERIAALRGDLGELNEQIRQLERERAISERVVLLAQRDLSELEPSLSQVRGRISSGEENRLTAIVATPGRVYSVDQAQKRAHHIRETQAAYSNRAADADHDLAYLRNQAERMEQMLLELETERADFQTQIAQLDRQVDAIARNNRLIEMLEERQETLAECSRYEAASLDQIVAKLAEARSRQEATLEYLAGASDRRDYEEIAEQELRVEKLGEAHELPADPAMATAGSLLRRD